MTDDIFIYLIDIPEKTKEIVVPCQMGYTIYINKNLDEKQRKDAYEHAMRHIRNNDWESTRSADLIEFYAHEL